MLVAPCPYRAANYFGPGKHEDHWVCEYWDESERRWKILDAQFDQKFVDALGIEHDITDVPADRFCTASRAWRSCRSGENDPMDFGIEKHRMRGSWFVAGSLVRDMATLNKVEVLPWDVWGAQPAPDTDMSQQALAFFDGVAELTADPDTNHGEIRRRYAADPGLTVPATGFNSMLQRRDRMPQEAVVRGLDIAPSHARNLPCRASRPTALAVEVPVAGIGTRLSMTNASRRHLRCSTVRHEPQRDEVRRTVPASSGSTRCHRHRVRRHDRIRLDRSDRWIPR